MTSSPSDALPDVGDDRRAGRDQAGRHGQQERPGAGHENPVPRDGPAALEQRLHATGRHHAGQRPTRKRHLPVVGPGR
jgi:hypothetical protein